MLSLRDYSTPCSRHRRIRSRLATLDDPPVVRPNLWPQPHQRDSSFKSMRLFVYPLFDLTATVASAASKFLCGSYGSERECLLRGCNLGWSPIENLRQHTSELLVLMRLVQSCTIVTDPASADGFLVPALLGMQQALGWHSFAVPTLRTLVNLTTVQLVEQLHRRLVHLRPETAARHIFLQTVDSCHTGLRPSRGAASPFLPTSSIVVVRDGR